MKKVLLNLLLICSAQLSITAATTKTVAVGTQTNGFGSVYSAKKGVLNLGATPAYNYIGDILETIICDKQLFIDFINTIQEDHHNAGYQPASDDSIKNDILSGRISYEKIIDAITSRKHASGERMIKVIEQSLMKLYDSYSYDKKSIFIKRNYENIFKNSKAVTQIIEEMEQLANALATHYPEDSYRIKRKASYYRNWRKWYTRRALLGVATVGALGWYFGANKQK